MPPSPTSIQDSPSSPHLDRRQNENAISMHWGHIVFFYLAQQMKRWERFVFRFDKQFTSMGALKAINGTVLGHQFRTFLTLHPQGMHLV